MESSDESVEILYDGDCPFCTRYVRWLRLRKNLKTSLVSARESSPLRDEATRLGYDLDRGMLVRYGGRFYYAEEAITILTLLSTPSDTFNKLVIALLRSPRRAKILYPVFALIRRATVLALGRGTIGNLKPPQ